MAYKVLCRVHVNITNDPATSLNRSSKAKDTEGLGSIAIDETVFQRLLENHLPRVRSIVERIRQRLPSTIEADDLYSIGVTGLVEWPILLAVGGGALLLRKMNKKPEEPKVAPKAKLTTVPSEPEPQEAAPAPPASKAAPARKAAARKTTGRRAGATALRSTN